MKLRCTIGALNPNMSGPEIAIFFRSAIPFFPFVFSTALNTSSNAPDDVWLVNSVFGSSDCVT